MKKKLIFLLLVVFLSMFAVSLTKVNAEGNTYHASTGSELVYSEDGGVAYQKGIAHADMLDVSYGEGIEITEDNKMINLKGHVVNLYRLKVFVYYADGTQAEGSRLFDSKDGGGLTEAVGGYFEYHGDLGQDWVGKTVTKISYQCYTTDKTTERIGELQILGMAFDANGTWTNFAPLYEAEGSEPSDQPTITPDPDPQPEPVGDVVIGDITTTADATIVKTEDGVQTITYSVKPGWATFDMNVSNYNQSLTQLEVQFTTTSTTYICFMINGLIDWSIGHREYAAGNNTFKYDVTSLALPTEFVISMYIDAEEGVAVDSEKSITFTSIKLSEPEKQPEIPDDGSLFVSPITSSANAAIVSGDNGQTITYSVKPGWSTFNMEVKNYDANLSVLQVKFTASENVKICFMINGVIDWSIAHKEYVGGKEQTFTYDVSALNLPSDFTISMYIDAEDDVVVDHEKSVTFHSFVFKTPDPLPEGMWLSEPNASSMSCLEADAGWDIKYNNDASSWRNIAININNYDVNYDIIKISVDLTAGTNLGIRLIWTESGYEKYADIRNHHNGDGVAEETGTYELVYHVGAFGAKGMNLTRLELYFDAPTSYTTNTGDVTAKLNSYEFLASSELTLSELEYTVNNTVVDYTGSPAVLDIVCAENVKFVVEYSQVLEGIEEVVWFDGIPSAAGLYNIRVTYAGSLVYNYKSVEATLTINKVQAPVNAEAVTYDGASRVVTVLAGYEASIDEEFAAGSEVYSGDVVPYGTVIYFRHAGNNNYTPSEISSITVERPAEPTPLPPTEEPTPVPPTEDPAGDDSDDDGGCGGSIVGSIVAVATLLGVVAVCKKRKED